MIYNNDISIIQKQIKHIMIDSDIQQQEIADKMHKSKQAINKLLKDNNSNYTLNTLYQLCNALNCDLHIDIIPR